jgi:hypothetical protein
MNESVIHSFLSNTNYLHRFYLAMCNHKRTWLRLHPFQINIVMLKLHYGASSLSITH